MSEDKCSVTDGKFVSPCSALAEVTIFTNPSPKAKGVFHWRLSAKGKATRSFVGVKSGEHTKKGLLFNYCPFCGIDISAPFTEKEASPEQPEK